MSPELVASILALEGREGIAGIARRDEQTFLITTVSLFEDDEPVRIQVRTSEHDDEELVATDGGSTIARLRTLVDESKLDASVRWHLESRSGPNIVRQKDTLTLSQINADSLWYSVTMLGSACASFVALQKAMTDFDRSRKEHDLRKRDEREAKSFQLSSREEVVAFENRLQEFSLRERIGPLRQISLVDAYDVFEARGDRQQLVTALLDLVVSYCMLRLEVRDSLGIWKSHFGEGGFQSGSILESDLAFSLRMHIHRFDSSFVLRYRALWDKLMGVYVLVFEPGYYKTFHKVRSKKKAFLKAASQQGSSLGFFARDLLDLLTAFDNNYRYPEAHNTGKIRKWTLIIEPYEGSPQHELNVFWLRLDSALEELGDIFRGVERVQTANVRKTEVWLESQELPEALRARFAHVLEVLRCAIPTLARDHAKELPALIIYGRGYVRSVCAWRLNRNRETFARLMAHEYEQVVAVVQALPAEVRQTGEALVKALDELREKVEAE